MSTLVKRYIHDLRAAVKAAGVKTENSPVRAHTSNDPAVVSIQPGAERVVPEASFGRVTRQREIHVMVHTAGNEHLEACEDLLELIHPLIMKYEDEEESIVQIDELSTEEPKYAKGDLTRQVTAKRYLITYQTEDDSLSH